MKPQADYSSFESLDMRVGRIIKVEDSLSKKPAYRLTVDFGPEIGTKISCGAYRAYAKESLIGKQVIAIINFVPKKMGPEVSEALILGAADEKGEVKYLKPESDVSLGESVF